MKKVSNWIKNNKLFISYIILSLLISILLRLITIESFIGIKALFFDTLIVTFIGLFAYLFKPQSRFTYFLIWIFFFTFLSIGDTIYYKFYQSFLSINLISTASMIGEVNDSLFAKLHFYQFVYLIFPIIYIIYHKELKKKGYEEGTILVGKRFIISTSIFVLIFIVAIVCAYSFGSRKKFVNQYNREYIVKKYGLYLYTFNDLVQSIQIDGMYGYDEDVKTFTDFYSCKEKNQTNEYTNIFKGKNVLFIHAESIQNFLINLKINGQEVTPNINKLASSGMYFSKFYPQISVGTSSDTEFTLLTGLMPSSSGTVFVNYYDRTYYGMPSYFNDLGYYTFSTHANYSCYWNREVMHKNLGYKDFIAKDSYIVPEDKKDPDYIILGLSDKSFFKQFIPKLKDIKENKSPYYGTVITLSNHSPFNDLEKYGEFDVTMKYSKTDKYGRKTLETAPYLENSSMGNYIKSAHYADQALGEFIEELQKENLLENTIIVFYGDHEARLSKKEFNLLYNYDPETNDILDEDDPNYVSMENYNYDLLKNTPLIIWSNEENYNKEITSVMGMYDVLPTIANMFGFEEKYALGHDIFSNNEHIVVFPNGNILTDKVYYSDSNEEYIMTSNEPIDTEYIDRIKDYADKVLTVSNGIIKYDLIKYESDKIGECKNGQKN